jgi:hypothetical protein
LDSSRYNRAAYKKPTRECLSNCLVSKNRYFIIKKASKFQDIKKAPEIRSLILKTIAG